MADPTRLRQVQTELPLDERRCLYCLGRDGTFERVEHVIPRCFGHDTDRFAIAPGVVCDDCNEWLGHQVDASFANRFDIKLTRGLEELAGRGGVPSVIEGRDATHLLTLELEGATVATYATRAEETADGGLEIEIQPQQRDPHDVVERTMRALWKMALGVGWLDRRSEALHPKWDHLRHAVLGAPFKGFLLQRPFIAAVTHRLDVAVTFQAPEDPWAMSFRVGGVALAVPLAQHAGVSREEARHAGWELHTTGRPAPTTLHFRLHPDTP